MRRHVLARCTLPLAGLALVSLFTACAEDVVDRGRPDSGIAPLDGGSVGPLALTAGMRFTYHAILTRRGEAQGEEENSQYDLTLTIDSVTDRRGNGESTLTFHASSPSTMADRWMAPYDYDSWVARLGPSLRDDLVDTAPVTARLAEVPTIPAAPAPSKHLPAAGTFFLDVRDIETIRAHFAEQYADRRPQVTDPSTGGEWRFYTSGPDSSIVYYATKTREVVLGYDPRGFLKSIEENLGSTTMNPSANCRLELTSGP